MSLFSFFPLQRRHWRKLAATLSPEFVAGALTALHLAEKTFRASPQHNLHVQIHQLQRQLDEAVYKQLRGKEELVKLQEKLVATRKMPAELPPTLPTPPVAVVRRALRKILKVVTHAQLLPANKLNLIEELTLAALLEMDQQPTEPAPQSPDPPLPLS